MPNLNSYLFNFAVNNRNFKLILLMDKRNLLQSIQKFDTYLFLDAHQYFYENGRRVQMDEQFFNEWNNVILCCLLGVFSFTNPQNQVLYAQLIDVLHTSNFWRDVFVDYAKPLMTSTSLTLSSPIPPNNCLVQLIQNEWNKIQLMQRYCKHITSSIVFNDIIDFILLPMI